MLPGLLNRLPSSPRKVAILRASRVGDFICATPALRALRKALPEAEITLISLPMLRDLVERLPSVDRFAAFPGYPGVAEQLFDARAAADFFKAMQAHRFDLAIQMQESGVNSNPFTLMLGARLTAGFIRAGDPPGRLDAAFPIPRQGHEIRRILALAEFLGAAPDGEHTDFPLLPAERAAARKLLVGLPPPWIGLHFAARDNSRRWSLDRFAAAGRKLARRFGGTLVLLGEAAECVQAAVLMEQIGPAVPTLDLVGKTSLPGLGALIASLSLLVTNDSGPAHVAYALSTPTVTIFGGADPRRYAPLLPGPFRPLTHPVLCRPCGYADCPIGAPCLEHISVEQVVAAAAEIVRKD